MILSVLLFLGGIHMMVMLLAGLYRYIDLWYRIDEFWISISARLLVLVGIDALIVYLLPTGLASAFLWGQVSYLLFHFAIYWVIRFLIGAFALR